MSAPLNIPALRREWRMSKALKDADLNKDVAGERVADNQARWDDIQTRHDERTEATFAVILQAENTFLTIRDVWAILNLALCVKEDDEDPDAAMPLFRKAERVLRELRDAQVTHQGPEPEERPEQSELAISDVLGPLESKISDLATLSRLIAAQAFHCTFAPVPLGKQPTPEEQMLQDVLAGLGFIRDEAERLEAFLGQHWSEVAKSWPR